MKRKSKKAVQSIKTKKAKDTIILSKDYNIILVLLVLIIPVITSFYYIYYSYTSNGVFCFPLDDPWIHLTFAKNITEYFSFSYFKDELVTAGSTSPLFTFILSLGYLFYKNEMLLSYILGVIFFSASAYVFFKLSIIEFPGENILAFLVTCVLVLDKWINFISLSGMETSMFILSLILCSYFYKIRKAVPFAVTLGLIVWIRPDGIAFIPAVILTYILEKYYYSRNKELKFFDNFELKKIVYISTGILLMYCLMNLYLSGSILPNTYNAKIAFFVDTEKRLNYLTVNVWNYFMNGYYSILMIGFIFSISNFAFSLYKRTYNQNTLYIFFILNFLFIYTVKLPALNRFGRYVIPLIPFFILVSLIGFNDLFKLFNSYFKKSYVSKLSYFLLFTVIFISGFKDFEKEKEEYQRECKHIYDRQVVTANWLYNNTNETDVIATHDIGAIGFYSGRKIVDIAGLVNTELNEKLNDYNYSEIITKYCNSQKVSYLVILNEWYSVINQNPVFSAPEFATRENMDVYKFYPGKTRVLSKEAHRLMWDIFKEFETKNYSKIISLTNKVIELEPEYAYAYLLRGNSYLQLGDIIKYEADVKHTIFLYPDFNYALLSYANFLSNQKRFEDAKEHFKKLVELEPSNKDFRNYLKNMDDSLNSRTLKKSTEK